METRVARWGIHNIVQFHNNVLWDWQYTQDIYIYIYHAHSPHTVWMWGICKVVLWNIVSPIEHYMNTNNVMNSLLVHENVVNLGTSHKWHDVPCKNRQALGEVDTKLMLQYFDCRTRRLGGSQRKRKGPRKRKWTGLERNDWMKINISFMSFSTTPFLFFAKVNRKKFFYYMIKMPNLCGRE